MGGRAGRALPGGRGARRRVRGGATGGVACRFFWTVRAAAAAAVFPTWRRPPCRVGGPPGAGAAAARAPSAALAPRCAAGLLVVSLLWAGQGASGTGVGASGGTRGRPAPPNGRRGEDGSGRSGAAWRTAPRGRPCKSPARPHTGGWHGRARPRRGGAGRGARGRWRRRPRGHRRATRGGRAGAYAPPRFILVTVRCGGGPGWDACTTASHSNRAPTHTKNRGRAAPLRDDYGMGVPARRTCGAAATKKGQKTGPRLPQPAPLTPPAP